MEMLTKFARVTKRAQEPNKTHGLRSQPQIVVEAELPSEKGEARRFITFIGDIEKEPVLAMIDVGSTVGIVYCCPYERRFYHAATANEVDLIAITALPSLDAENESARTQAIGWMNGIVRRENQLIEEGADKVVASCKWAWTHWLNRLRRRFNITAEVYVGSDWATPFWRQELQPPIRDRAVSKLKELGLPAQVDPRRGGYHSTESHIYVS